MCADSRTDTKNIHVTYYMSPVTCLALTTFQAMLVQTALMLKHLEPCSLGSWMAQQKHNKHMDILTYRQNWPRGWISKNILGRNSLPIWREENSSKTMGILFAK